MHRRVKSEVRSSKVDSLLSTKVSHGTPLHPPVATHKLAKHVAEQIEVYANTPVIYNVGSLTIAAAGKDKNHHQWKIFSS